MSKMYFDVNPDAAHDIHDLAVVLLGQKMNFYTDAGVFSKKMIDYGSQVLLSTWIFKKEKVSLMLAVAMDRLASLWLKPRELP